MNQYHSVRLCRTLDKALRSAIDAMGYKSNEYNCEFHGFYTDADRERMATIAMPNGEVVMLPAQDVQLGPRSMVLPSVWVQPDAHELHVLVSECQRFDLLNVVGEDFVLSEPETGNIITVPSNLFTFKKPNNEE